MTVVNERLVSQAIIERWCEKFTNCLELDVAVVGGGPSGMLAAWKLAERGYKVALFERKLSLGGGMWGGGMTYNFIVVQDAGKRLLEELGVPTRPYGEGYHTADAVTATTTLASRACLAGTQVFNCLSVEDVVLREEGGIRRVTGLVVNSTPVEMTGLHVDPLVVHCRAVIEATGHAVEVLKTLTRKNDVRLDTPDGRIAGEQSMWADKAEADTLENTREIFPGVWVAGMAANASFGSYRMGPIFGGMLLSGEKVAEDIAVRLGGH
ncbi:MAG TPA: sulfide-dependent adenosine diphosphate thiazole synthase [Desulfovibrio sp.]|uniref:sulfide-dependent adenosine diphosphate thiazole synthase n=1 Tax=Desulfovibrio sp. TaxID=885 RepID=UPI002CB54A6E|nr:sulfide-dependent adenosine diphosphate thiazole synthase [Desulfovibrio sp.]HMM38425.1 sulfide-dependent adenosine diphosphate thiazole synthase [Desulfovibrio sp.]